MLSAADLLQSLRKWQNFLASPHVLGRSFRHPLASPKDVGACRTPRPSLYFFGQCLPFMSHCASPLENGALIHVSLRQTHSASGCGNRPKERQTESPVAGTHRTPSALDDVRWRCPPVVSELTFPPQFEFAAKIFCGQAPAPTCYCQISHCSYA